ncbi:hypothetical protein [Rosistilla oblonga]|uniref:hypothetical protein n=1 Tax=Rosistilla oblonga TaxID=2527990 RepID=UPI003A977D1D
MKVLVCPQLLLMSMLMAAPVFAQVVPGTGTKIDYVGDDFEEPGWGFVHNMPKGSHENNERRNGPSGYSKNRRFIEGPERGQPDHMQIIPTPAGGLPHSKNALWVSTLHSGIPGQNTRTVEQDDLIVSCPSRLGTSFRPSESPNCMVRVYFPEADRWEKRNGPHFGFRLGCSTTAEQEREGFLAFGTEMGPEPYWPGIWVHYRHTADQRGPAGSAYLAVRGDNRGRDFRVAEMEQFGWWTFGISVTPDGRIHYYASPGVDPLTPQDLLTSQTPYGFNAERVSSFFFNICNMNDGRTWSTPVVIDDPEMYLVNASRVMQFAQRKEAAEAKRQAYAKRRAEMMAERNARSQNNSRSSRK